MGTDRLPSFDAGESGDDGPTPPIETMGARYGISVAQPGRGAHEPQVDPYLLPPYAGRNGSNERVDPSIVQTPLGGMVPGPNAIAPAIPSGTVGAAFDVHSGVDAMEFGDGVTDGWPDGSPVPVR
jgi:hypothetical protein